MSTVDPTKKAAYRLISKLRRNMVPELPDMSLDEKWAVLLHGRAYVDAHLPPTTGTGRAINHYSSPGSMTGNSSMMFLR